MGVQTCLQGIFGVWSTPEFVTIQDWKLGILHWVLRVGIILYVVLSLFLDGNHLYKETPAGYPTFWFNAGGLYEAQNTTQQFCDNSEFNYYLDNESEAYFWNCVNHSCYNLHYGDIARKDVKSGFVTTVMKRQHTKVLPCSSGQDPCESLSASEGNRTMTRRVGNSCSCHRQQDYFIPGVDQMTLYMDHAFSTSPMIYQNEYGETIGGSSKYTSSDDTRRTIRTCLRLKGSSDCVKEFAPGKSIGFTIGEWLDFAGVSLDDRLKAWVKPDAIDGNYPQRRIIGVKLHINLQYDGSLHRDDWDCYMTVEAVDGWNSIGSQVKYIGLASEEEMEYFEDYKLGVSFEFFPNGIVVRWSPQRAFWTLIAGLVLLSFAEYVVSFVAFYILPEAVVYSNAAYGQLKYSKTLAQFGVSTALACHAFKEWDHKKEDDVPKLTKDELAEVFKGSFDAETADMLATTVASEVHKESLVCADLVELMSDGLVSIENVRQHHAKKLSRSAKVHAAEDKEAQNTSPKTKEAWN